VPAAVLVQADGKVVIGGAFTSYNGTNSNRLLRLLTNGSIDSSFEVVLNANATIGGISQMPDGRLVITGTFTQVNGVSRNRIAVLTADGQLADSNLNFALNYAGSAVTDSGVIYGYASTANQALQVARYPDLAAGNDTLFSGNANIRGTLGAVPNGMLASGENLLVFGGFQGIGATPNAGGLLWLAARTAAGPPTFVNAPLSQTVVEGRAAVLTAQVVSASQPVLYAWTRVGDPTILSTSTNLTLSPALMATAGDYRLVVSNAQGAAEAVATVQVVPAAERGPGTLRPAFQARYSGPQTFGTVSGLAAAADGGLWVVSNSGLLKLDAVSGVVQETAHTGIAGLAVDLVGRLYVWGWFTELAGHPTNRLARLLADGTVDTTFTSPFAGQSLNVVALAFAPDGSVFVGGNIPGLMVNGRPTQHVVKLTSSGAIDHSFDPQGGVGELGAGSVAALLLQADGRLVVAGNFNQAAGATRSNLVRFLADGRLDSGFNNIAISGVEQMMELADGKLLVSGSITQVDGLNRPAIVRLMANGTVDRTFRSASDLLHQVRTFALLEDGRIVVAGSYQDGGFNLRPRVAVLMPDGGIDTTFFAGNEFYTLNPSTGAISGLGSVSRLLVLPAGDVVIGGNFGRINDDVLRANIVRLEGIPQTVQLPQTLTFVAPGRVAFSFDGLILSATASSGLPVGFELVSGSATLTGGRLLPQALGSVIVRAVQAGDGQYLAAEPVERTIEFVASYDHWLLTTFSAQERAQGRDLAIGDDFDGDGWSNLVEYALGSDPRDGATVPELLIDPTTSDWVFYYVRAANRPDLSVQPEWTSGLTQWSPAGSVQRVSVLGDYELMEFRVARSAASHPLFRLHVQQIAVE
jgi:uncharacterized delta-60 repeat protein